MKKSSFQKPPRNIERRRLSSSGNGISPSQGDRRQTIDLAEMRQRSIELGAPSEPERRRQSAHFADRGRDCDLVAAERAQVRPVGVTQGENTLYQSRCPMAALPGMARRTRTSAIRITQRSDAFEDWLRQERGLSRRRYKITAAPPTTSSLAGGKGIPLAAVQMIRHRRCHCGRAQAGEPGAAGRYTITLNV